MLIYSLVWAKWQSIASWFAVTCWERADLLAHFPNGVLGQVWYMILSIPEICPLLYFNEVDMMIYLPEKRPIEQEIEVNICFVKWLFNCEWKCSTFTFVTRFVLLKSWADSNPNISCRSVKTISQEDIVIYEDKLGQSEDRILSSHIWSLDIVLIVFSCHTRSPPCGGHCKTKRSPRHKIYFMTSRLREIHV